MFRKKYLTFILLLCATNYLYAQKDTIVRLEEVIISSYKLKKYSKGYYVKILSDSIIAKNSSSLTDVLRFNSFLYFKENGSGMVSSPSFRGTSASQTAVIWNGININSQLTGQSDFNTLGINFLDEIAIRSGGGSVLFGSGAIGGSVHLNNSIDFRNSKESSLTVGLASFNTQNIYFKTKKSTTNKYVDFGIGMNRSDNDFNYLESDLFNDNAAYYNITFSGNFGFKINEKNRLKFYTNTFLSDRDLSRSLTAPSLSKYKDNTSRNLLEWNHFLTTKQIISSRFVYLYEAFTYFENKLKPELFSGGQSNSKIFNLDYKNSISKNVHLNAVFGFEQVHGRGDNLQNRQRTVYSGVVILNHQITKKVSYSAQLRKEFLKSYKAPFVYSLGVEYQANKNYSISFNTSKNFRAPTFNDLYWLQGGNPVLKPENSYQFELGNNLKLKNFNLQVNGFYIKSDNLIQWRPNSSGSWMPSNVSKALNYGSEVSFENQNKIKENHFLSFSSNYSYTIAKDQEKVRDLIYVPKHRFNATSTYKIRDLSIYYQQLFNGKVFVIADELPSYFVGNLGFEYQLSKMYYGPKIGLTINNVFNKNYQNVQNRPMPTRNIQIKFKLNF